MSEPLLIEDDGHVVTLILNRPDAANALSRDLVASLFDALDTLRSSDARVAVITGAGEKAFCAGADLRERKTMSVEEVRAFVPKLQTLTDSIAALPMPTIAAINGAAFGGGCEIALACDLRVIATGAKIGLTETSLAIIPGAGGTARLPRLVGVGKAKELIYTAARLDAARALEIGLVSAVSDDAVGAARALADRIAKNGPLAVRAAKQSIDAGAGLPTPAALAVEREAYASIIDTHDREEGLRAFAEKRDPNYEGR
jgi:methylglutaconyl-CoA hydratase